jgi:hypothetical protein
MADRILLVAGARCPFDRRALPAHRRRRPAVEGAPLIADHLAAGALWAGGAEGAFTEGTSGRPGTARRRHP